MKVTLCAEKFEGYNGILLTMNDSSGFRELPHTADWELEIWAPELTELLRQAVLGMQSLSGMQLDEKTRQVRTLSLDSMDAENLLVRFLNEMLWLAEQDHLGFDCFEFHLSHQGEALDLNNPIHLEVRMHGASIARLIKEIKAVTYHNLELHQTWNGLTAHIVFDI